MSDKSIAGELCRHLAHVTGLQLVDAFALLHGWKVVPYVYGGQVAGGAIISGTEVHVYMRPEFRIKAFKRTAIRGFLTKLIGLSKLGFLTTRVPVTEVEDLRFVARLGFEETNRDEQCVYFMLTRLPFNRKGNRVWPDMPMGV